MPRYLDVDTDVVASAGRTTAGTSTNWESWAGHVDGQLRNAAAQSNDPVVTAAFENHLSTWNPKIQGMAKNANALGTNATSAANVVTNADSGANAALSTTGTSANGMTSMLRRPITTAE